MSRLKDYIAAGIDVEVYSREELDSARNLIEKEVDPIKKALMRAELQRVYAEGRIASPGNGERDGKKAQISVHP